MTELHRLKCLVDVSGSSMNILIMKAIQLLSVQGGILFPAAHPLYFQVIHSLLYIVYHQKALQQLSCLSLSITVVKGEFLHLQIPTLETLMTKLRPSLSLVADGNCTLTHSIWALVLYMDKVTTQLQTLCHQLEMMLWVLWSLVRIKYHTLFIQYSYNRVLLDCLLYCLTRYISNLCKSPKLYLPYITVPFLPLL